MSEIILHHNSFGGNARNSSIIIANVEIFRDEHGRYNLNALHRASEASENQSKAPSQWLRRKSTKELIVEVESQNVNLHSGAIEVVNGGDRQGVYADEILAVEYAGWISPRFRILVNRAFIDSKAYQDISPLLSDPSLQMLMEQSRQMQAMIIRLDRAQIEAAQAKENAAQAQSMALQVMQAQQYLTIREFVIFNDLTRQCPPGTTQQQFGKYMAGYCREHGWPLRKMGTENSFPEWAYPAHLLQQNIFSFLSRRNGQIEIDEDGIWSKD